MEITAIRYWPRSSVMVASLISVKVTFVLRKKTAGWRELVHNMVMDLDGT